MFAHHFYRWLIAGAIGTSTAMSSDVSAAPTWHVALDQGHREGLTSAPDRVELSLDAQPSQLYFFPREGRLRTNEWSTVQPPATVTLRMDAAIPPGTAVVAHLRARSGNRWRPWQKIDPDRPLALKTRAQALQLRLILLSTGSSTPVVKRIDVIPDGKFVDDLSIRSLLRGQQSFRIFATREGLVGRKTANGHRIRSRDHFVALPAWTVLNDLGENDYQVRITYRDRSVVVPVWDVGPWNTHDNYWSGTREMWNDLPLGVPEAQAAYEDGYNGGRDERGRKLRLPNGIDIADGTFWDDLQMSNPGWVEVSFLWMGDERTETAPADPIARPSADSPPPVARITEAAQLSNRKYFVRWYGKPTSGKIASFDVQVRRGANGAWKDWLVDERATEGLFSGKSDGSNPMFRVRARDKAGNLGDFSPPVRATGRPAP